MRTLVTGGAGFIGANLCRRLAGEGAEVRVLDDLSTGCSSNLDGLDVDLVEGSVIDAGLVARAASDVDHVVHLAARASVPRSIAEPVAAHEANVTGTLTVLEAARTEGVGVVVASSSSVYGDTEVSPKHEGLPVAPRSPYAATKLATEAYALSWQVAYGLPVLALRFFNVYGPLQPADHAYAAVVPRFVDAALAGRPLQVHGDGRQSRDFTFVATVVEVLRRAVVEGTSAPGPVNLAFGTRTDLLDLVGRLEAVVGRPLDVRHTEPRPGDVRHSTADGSRLAALFPGLEPVELDDGLRATVDWFRSEAEAPGEV
ncbi:MAG TPA: NAD-dependent epimerase/dehydratase family protein [Acidimicrobiales bacterium]|nr:NAD-dependent epimerase/dehydratase family protein [Acidimicrobiales bacterium]